MVLIGVICLDLLVVILVVRDLYLVIEQSYCVLKFGQVNVNSLLNKVNYISTFARDCKLDILAVSESLLVQNVLSSFVAVDGYSVVRGDVQRLTRKHGVCLYVRFFEIC